MHAGGDRKGDHGDDQSVLHEVLTLFAAYQTTNLRKRRS